MSHIKAIRALQYFIYSTLVALISLSPSLNIIPKYLAVISFHDSKRLVELLLVSLVFLYYAMVNSHELPLTANYKVRYAFYVLFALTIASSLLAEYPRHALTEVSLFVGLAYFTLFIAAVYNKNNTLLIKCLTYALWGSILLYMTSFYTGYITAIIFNTSLKWPQPFTGFNNIRSFNQYQLWTLGLLTLPLLNADFKLANMRHWLNFGLACWWVLLFYSSSRGVLIAWLVGVFITAIVYRKWAWSFIRLQLIHITTGFLSYLILFKLIPTLLNFTLITSSILRDTTQDRLALWQLSVQLIHSHPFFGVGPMHFAWASKTSAHPHNFILQMMAEWGLPAALTLLTITAYGLICWLKRFNAGHVQNITSSDRNLSIALFFTLTTCAAYSLVDGVIVMPISQVMMFTTIGVMLGLYNDYHKTKVNMPVNMPSAYISMRLLAVIALATLAWGTAPEILQGTSGSDKRFSMGYTAIGPRFWLEIK